MPKNKIFLVITALLVIGSSASLYVFLHSKKTSGHDSVAQARLLPDVALTRYDGSQVRTREFQGKPMLINVWATWCPYCRKELPDLGAVGAEYGDRITILAVNRKEAKDISQHFSDTIGGKVEFLLDPSDALYEAMGGFSMPETLFVDRDGKIVYHKRGPMTYEEIRRRVQELFVL